MELKDLLEGRYFYMLFGKLPPFTINLSIQNALRETPRMIEIYRAGEWFTEIIPDYRHCYVKAIQIEDQICNILLTEYPIACMSLKDRAEQFITIKKSIHTAFVNLDTSDITKDLSIVPKEKLEKPYQFDISINYGDSTHPIYWHFICY